MMEVAEVQRNTGRMYYHEFPEEAPSMGTARAREVRSHSENMEVKVGEWAAERGQKGKLIAMTNSKEVAAEVKKEGARRSREVHIRDPERNTRSEVKAAILRGMCRSLKRQGRVTPGGVGTTVGQEVMELNQEWFGSKEVFYDNISGEWLNPNLVKEARKEEMAEVRKHKVYEKEDVIE